MKTNLEAVREVVYQLRLRNIGGIIIVDFIDMAREENKEIVWNALSQALKGDRSRTRILKISQLGLAEITRKRVRESLTQTLCDPCNYCEGKGFIKSTTTVCYEIVREIQKFVSQNSVQKMINVVVHPATYDLMFEEESSFIEETQEKYKVEISFRVDQKMHKEKYKITTA